MRIIRYSYPPSRRAAFVPSVFSRAPWSGLEDQIDRLFETALSRSTPGQNSPSQVPLDLFEDKDQTYVRAELPGVNREDVNVEIVDGYLTLSATRKTAATDGNAEETFSFSRSLELPEEVQADKISAVLENGILTVTLPKREETKPRKISVNVK